MDKGKKTSAASTTKRSTTRESSGRTAADSRKRQTVIQQEEINTEDTKASIRDEIALIVTILVSVLLILSYFNLCGPLGVGINFIIFGLIGIVGYVFPLILFMIIAYHISNRNRRVATNRIILTILLIWFICGLIQMIAGGHNEEIRIIDHFSNSLLTYKGSLKTYGGFLGGMLCTVLCSLAGNIAATIIIVAAILILLILLTGKALLSYVRGAGRHIDKMQDNKYREYEEYEPEQEPMFPERNDNRTGVKRKLRLKGLHADDDELDFDYLFDENRTEAREDKEKPNFIEELKRKGRGNTGATENISTGNAIDVKGATEVKISEKEIEEMFSDTKPNDEVYSINETRKAKPVPEVTISGTYRKDSDSIIESELKRKFGRQEEDKELEEKVPDEVVKINQREKITYTQERAEYAHMEYDEAEDVREASDKSENVTKLSDRVEAIQGESERAENNKLTVKEKSEISEAMSEASQAMVKSEYKLPPLNLLVRAKSSKKGSSERELKETAAKLKETLESFGVGVSITNISCGPTVTRYEVQPDHGVKVAKITALVDDIKLNLEATDIRIEAPIPGKSAVGIEVPNQENVPVLLRDLLESDEFKNSESHVSIAVGRDVNGNTIIANIADMPHLLVAGATGSGKSVCINTIIMSLLYKSSPKDLRLILIDPKVVELNNYNGIPHLLVPVVTDPKKAGAALGWAVNEMDNRYNMFAAMGVRDLKQYNYRVEEMEYQGDETAPEKLPEIVIIVDELSDLMMTTNGKEVEDLIVRLTQKARAAGIHVILATQRPTVSVITGLIKANVPSRIAFSVSSATDSRIILDSMGAERLLGKGDMLFLQAGLPKAIRLQGAYVSDKEVNDVVDFVKKQVTAEDEQSLKNEHQQNEKKILETGSTSDSNNDRDDYFEQVGRFIIEKDRASIGMLQRFFSIGFNRAARIMDQLADAGVVGPEEKTKPRKILMTAEEFEAFLRQER